MTKRETATKARNRAISEVMEILKRRRERRKDRAFFRGFGRGANKRRAFYLQSSGLFAIKLHRFVRRHAAETEPRRDRGFGAEVLNGLTDADRVLKRRRLFAEEKFSDGFFFFFGDGACVVCGARSDKEFFVGSG